MKKTTSLILIIFTILFGCKDTGTGSITGSSVKYQIAYVTGDRKNVYVVNSNGSNNHSVVTDNKSCGTLKWTPDIKSLIFQKYIYSYDSTEHDTASLWKVDVDTKREKQLFTKAEVNIYSIAVSPSGNKIAFSLHHSTNDASEMDIMNIDGSEHKVLFYELNRFAYSPVWLPSGEKLLFSIDNQIYSIKPDKTELQKITNEQGDNSDFSLSPDGQKIVFNNIENYNTRIFITNVDGTNTYPITPRYSYMLHGLQWSYNGKYIIFTKEDSLLTEQIFRMDSTGENIIQLTLYDGGNRFYPKCTPDNNIIYYSNNTTDLQIIDINGKSKRHLIQLDNGGFGFSYYDISGIITL